MAILRPSEYYGSCPICRHYLSIGSIINEETHQLMCAACAKKLYGLPGAPTRGGNWDTETKEFGGVYKREVAK